MTSTNTNLHNTVVKINRGGFVKPIELAKALGIRPQQVYGYIRTGKIASVREEVTGNILVAVEAASLYCEARDKRAQELADKAALELLEQNKQDVVVEATS